MERSLLASKQSLKMTHVQRHQARTGKETIHSGHFMVSHFEAEAQDDYDDLAVPVPDEEQVSQKVSVVATYVVPGTLAPYSQDKVDKQQHQQLSIETSLTKLFKCMTLAYRQKLTSPKWNRFKGIKLRWKDKIRLNNVIWRCWHMQFIKKQNTLVCQFASPLDVDTHVKPEATILEGKYWKRRAEAVIAEYKKWRMFHITRIYGKGDTGVQDTIMDTVESLSQCEELAGTMLTDEDYLNFMSDTLFSTITSHQPFAFPDPREIARGASLADFIQPSLGPLQPNLEDFMDTLEPFQDMLSTSRLPPVPEESALTSDDAMYRNAMAVDSYSSHNYLSANQNTTNVNMNTNMNTNQMTIHGSSNNAQMISSLPPQNVKNEQMQMYDNGRLYNQPELHGSMMTQDMPSYSSAPYDVTTSTDAYGSKMSRLNYVNTQKVITAQDNAYNKFNSAPLPPSHTAPETVSLLQQPAGASKMAAGRGAGFTRDKRRVPPPYPAYPAHAPHPPPAIYDNRTIQYMQPAASDNYKNKTVISGRSFKMPSPPLLGPSTPQMSSAVSVVSGVSGVSGVSAVRGTSASASKDSFRSTSLPLGAQLNADWSISAPTDTNRQHAHAPRPRESGAGAIRLRSRSSSSSALVDGAGPGRRPPPLNSVASEPTLPQASVVLAHLLSAKHSKWTHNHLKSYNTRSRSSSSSSSALVDRAGAGRRPPPLNSVASEPMLPQDSVVLAHLLSAKHSQSVYKMNSSTEDGVGASEPNRSPLRRGQPSPSSDIVSPHCIGGGSLVGSPSTSPPASPGSPREPRRTHMHAEQKRRYNIKNGFDTLQALIPHLNNNPTTKVSKAAMLQKGADYIKQLKAERNQIKEEMESLRQQIECLNNSISNCHSLLPATGAPVSRARADRLREMFARHVATRTLHNWKYWLFSVVAAALVESFSACVSCGSGADLVRTTLLWAEQHCSLVEMRPAVLNSLRLLCTTTDILSNPERLPDEARAAVASAGVKTEPS